ncbi:hypothetical protein [Massilia sp. SYSU DXS3249]
MRSINKSAEPRELINWKAENAKTPENLTYGGGGFPSEAVRKSLLTEQFYLCAYTLKRLQTVADCQATGNDTRASCHIEHVLPQARKISAETIDYRNMVACYPPSQSSVATEYGAPIKKDYDPQSQPFVSPLLPNAERHFKFQKDGEIIGSTAEGIATVKILNLNHRTLSSNRAAVIRGSLFPKQNKPITAAAARRLAAEILKPDANGCLPAYCVAIANVALAHADREERRAARIKGARQCP